MKIILTGATGMVGEGVLLECLQNETIEEVLSISRKPSGKSHPKLKELLVQDFTKLNDYHGEISGYDACFYCAGVSSVGMSEEQYHKMTYDTTIAFAEALLNHNTEFVFCYITGRGTDSSESGKTMWARVKGKTENKLTSMSFKGAYNFRPGAMEAFKQQTQYKTLYKIIVALFKTFVPSQVLHLREVARAMMNVTTNGYTTNTLEIVDIKKLGQ